MPTFWTYANAIINPTYGSTSLPFVTLANSTASSGMDWIVQYTSATTAVPTTPWPTQWQIVRPVISNYYTAVAENPWRPSAPAVIDHVRAAERYAAELERRAREEERRQAASERARQLLLGELDPVQRAQFEVEGHFVHLGRRGVRYRIRPFLSANIDVLRRTGKVRERLCVHPDGAYGMPVEDTMLAQLLHLRDDERALLKIANHHPALAPDPGLAERRLAA
jgi:hypothetical protein